MLQAAGQYDQPGGSALPYGRPADGIHPTAGLPAGILACGYQAGRNVLLNLLATNRSRPHPVPVRSIGGGSLRDPGTS
ncbi:hypothetical protein GCM10029963_76250 [Micromonospora andamanensis]|nr:hypothetical protein Vwe01_58710 [Micromonospora andamanensis]